jgi:hypothetical protein
MLSFYSAQKAALSAAAFGLVLFAGTVAAEAASINFEDFNYSGSVTRYDSLADAQANTNGTPYNIETAVNGPNSTLANARDAQIYADTVTNAFYFGTAWYFTPPGVSNPSVGGYGNPNNSNNGFVQIADDDGSSITSLLMGWDSTLTQFSVSAEGQNAGPTEVATSGLRPIWAARPPSLPEPT